MPVEMEDKEKKRHKKSFAVPKQHSGVSRAGTTSMTTTFEDKGQNSAGTEKKVKQNQNMRKTGEDTKEAICQPLKRKTENAASNDMKSCKKKKVDRHFMKVKVSNENTEIKIDGSNNTKKVKQIPDQTDKKQRKSLKIMKSLTEDEYSDIFSCVLQDAYSKDEQLLLDRKGECNEHHSASDEKMVDDAHEEQEENKMAKGGPSFENGDDQQIQEGKAYEQDNPDDNQSVISVNSEAVDDWEERPQNAHEENEMTPATRRPINTSHVVKSNKKAEKRNRLVPKKLFLESGSQKAKKKKNPNKSCLDTKHLREAVDEKEQEEGEGEESGTWVQCCNPCCNKWRYLSYVEDPSLVPELWECNMNLDKEHNSCTIPEVNYDESQHILTKFTIGSVVWAKMDGYPWWPAMIENDPDYGIYFEVLTESSMVPIQYHVTFFDDHVTRAWIKTTFISPYIKNEAPKSRFSNGHHPYKKGVEAAIKNADQAMCLNLKDRLMKFGFTKCYSRKGRKYGNKTSPANKMPKLNKRKVVVKKAESVKDSLNFTESKTHDEMDEVVKSMETTSCTSADGTDISDDSLECSEYIPVKSKSRQHSDDAKRSKIKEAPKISDEDSHDDLKESQNSAKGMCCDSFPENESLKAVTLKPEKACIIFDPEIFTMEAGTFVDVEADLPCGTVGSEKVAEDMCKDSVVKRMQKNDNKSNISKSSKKTGSKVKSKNVYKSSDNDVKKVHLMNSDTALEEYVEIEKLHEDKLAKDASQTVEAADEDEKDTVILDECQASKSCVNTKKRLSLKEKKLPWKLKNLDKVKCGKNKNAEQGQLPTTKNSCRSYGAADQEVDGALCQNETSDNGQSEDMKKVIYNSFLTEENVSQGGKEKKTPKRYNSNVEKKDAVSVINSLGKKASKCEEKKKKSEKNNEGLNLTEEKKVREDKKQPQAFPNQGKRVFDESVEKCESKEVTSTSDREKDLKRKSIKSINKSANISRQIKDESDKENKDPNINETMENYVGNKNSSDTEVRKKQDPKAEAGAKAGEKKLKHQKKNKQAKNDSPEVVVWVHEKRFIKEARNTDKPKESGPHKSADHKTSSKKAKKEKRTTAVNLKKLKHGFTTVIGDKGCEDREKNVAKKDGLFKSVITSKQLAISEKIAISENTSLSDKKRFKKNAPCSKVPEGEDQHVVPDIDCEVVDESKPMEKSELNMSPLERKQFLIETCIDKNEQKSLCEIDSCIGSDEEEEELDLSFDPGKVDRIVPQKTLSDGGISDSDSSLDLESDEGDKKVVVEGMQESQIIHGRFGGRCFEHGSDSDPLELIED